MEGNGMEMVESGRGLVKRTLSFSDLSFYFIYSSFFFFFFFFFLELELFRAWLGGWDVQKLPPMQPLNMHLMDSLTPFDKICMGRQMSL